VNGSYAYVAAYGSNALVVVDVSNPASPVIRGSVVSSSLMNGVCDPDLRAWLASGTALASASSIMLAPAAPPPADALSRSHSLARSLSRAVHAASGPRHERPVRLRGGAVFQLTGGDRREQPCISSHSGQRSVVVPHVACLRRRRERLVRLRGGGSIRLAGGGRH
jgi:hypothetical protein